MQFRRFVVPLAATLIIIAVSIWSQPVSAEMAKRDFTNSPRLPSGIVRVDGNGDTRVSISGGASCSKTSPEQAAAAVAATNSIRAQRDLPPLSTNAKLQHAAEAHACEMAMRGVMSHRGKSGSGPAARVKGSGYRPRLTAENIAAGRFDLNRVINEWARSPGHLSNMMIKGARHHGIGYAVSGDGKTIFWAALYARGR